VNVIWATEAHQNRIDIWDYIAKENPQAAVRMDALSVLQQPGWQTIQHWERPGKYLEPAS
jgi:hypothetical protein